MILFHNNNHVFLSLYIYIYYHTTVRLNFTKAKVGDHLPDYD